MGIIQIHDNDTSDMLTVVMALRNRIYKNEIERFVIVVTPKGDDTEIEYIKAGHWQETSSVAA